MASTANNRNGVAALDRLLFSSPSVEIGRFRVHPGDPRFADSGPIQRHIVVFPRSLVRIAHEGEDSFLAGPDCVTYYNRGQVYRRESINGLPDRCEWFAFQSRDLGDALDELEPAARNRPDRPFRFSHGPSDAASYAWQRQIVERVSSSPSTEPSKIEEACFTILGRLLKAAYRRTDGPLAPPNRRDRELAEATKSILAKAYRRRVRLEDIASGLAVSVFRLCRVFRRETGMTVHGFRSRLRLAASLELLRRMPGDLTEIGLTLGYSSHSHFTASFRREFGIPPSAFRAGLPAARNGTPLEMMNIRPEW